MISTVTPAPPRDAVPLVCRQCNAVLAWRWPSGYVRFVVAPTARRPDGRVVVICRDCGADRRI